MKRVFLAVCLLIGSFIALPVHAASPNPFGLGVIIGDPTGISAKYWVDKSEAIDAAIGFDHLSIHGDYLWHKWDLFPKPNVGELAAYCGPGLKIGDTNDGTEFGVRFTAGVAYELPHYHLEIFAEIVPVLDFRPDVDLNLDGGVGVRYYF